MSKHCNVFVDIGSLDDGSLIPREQRISIPDFVRRYGSKINFDPAYQREYVWDKRLIDNLIASIITKKSINSIHIATPTIALPLWSVIDGKQRLTTIFNFLGVLENQEKNSFKIKIKNKDGSYEKVGWKDIVQKANDGDSVFQCIKNNIEDHELLIYFYDNIVEEKQRTMFTNINSVKKFTTSEKLYCTNYIVRKWIKENYFKPIKKACDYLFSMCSSRFVFNKNEDAVRFFHMLIELLHYNREHIKTVQMEVYVKELATNLTKETELQKLNEFMQTISNIFIGINNCLESIDAKLDIQIKIPVLFDIIRFCFTYREILNDNYKVFRFITEYTNFYNNKSDKNRSHDKESFDQRWLEMLEIYTKCNTTTDTHDKIAINTKIKQRENGLYYACTRINDRLFILDFFDKNNPKFASDYNLNGDPVDVYHDRNWFSKDHLSKIIEDKFDIIYKENDFYILNINPKDQVLEGCI